MADKKHMSKNRSWAIATSWSGSTYRNAQVEQAVKGAIAAAPNYRGLAANGLIGQDYLNGNAGTGGIYLWETREMRVNGKTLGGAS
jgi:hypothetical protein